MPKSVPIARAPKKKKKSAAPFKGLQQQANRTAQAQLKPALLANSNEAASQDRAHTQRAADIGGWHDTFDSRVKGAIDRVTSSLGNLQTAAGSMVGDSTAGLNAALRQSQGSMGALESSMGVIPTGLTPEQTGVARAADQMAGAGGDALALNLGSLGAMMGSNAGVAGLSRVQAGEREIDRYGEIDQELSDERQEILARLPALRNEARGNLFQERMDKQQLELAKGQFGEQKAARLFQQYMAEKEFGLKEKNQDFQEWLSTQSLSLEQTNAAHTREMDFANLNLSRQQLAEETRRFNQELAASTGLDPEKKKLKAQQWNNAVQWIASYTAPRTNKKGKILPSKKQNRPDYDNALQILTVRYGLSKAEALRLMSTVQYQASDPKDPTKTQGRTWADRALTELGQLKGKSKGARNYKPNGRG